MNSLQKLKTIFVFQELFLLFMSPYFDPNLRSIFFLTLNQSYRHRFEINLCSIVCNFVLFANCLVSGQPLIAKLNRGQIVT